MQSEENEISAKVNELLALERKLGMQDKKRDEHLNSRLVEMKLMHTYMYVTSFSKRSQFQSSAIREKIVRKLLKELVCNSLVCLEEFKKGDTEIKIMYWIIASVEGFDLLMPFQSDNKCLRSMTKISLELKCLQTEFYEGAGELKESLALESLMTSLRRFNNTYLS